MSQPHTSSDAPGTARPGPRWFRALAAALGCLAALGIAEAALRLAYPGDNRDRFVRHAKFHHWHEANLKLTVTGEHGDFGGHVVHFNGDGMAMQAELPAADQPAIVFLGDSFTAGIEVSEEQRFVSRVGKELGRPAVNLGCASFSPVLSRLVWDEFSPRLQPTAVVLQLYANDLEGDQQMARLATRDGQGRITAVPHRGAVSFYLIRHSALARTVKQTLAARRFARQQRQHGHGEWQADPWSPAFTRPLTEWFTAEELVVTETAVLELAASASQRGAPFWLLPIPDRGAVKSGGPDYFCDYWRTLAQQHELGLIDLAEVITKDNVGEMFFATDIHLTPAGHAAVGRAVVEKLDLEMPP